MRTRITWDQFKDFADVYKNYLFCLQQKNGYVVWLDNSATPFEAVVEPGTADITEFEASYKSLCNQEPPKKDSHGNRIMSTRDTDGVLNIHECGFSCGNPSSLSQSILEQPFTIACFDVNGDPTTDTAAAVKTVLDFEPVWDFDIYGGTVQLVGTTPVKIYSIGVPDIPVEMGGNRVFCQNITLDSNFPSLEIKADGSKFMSYNAEYHTNKIRLSIFHPVSPDAAIRFRTNVYRYY